MPTLPLVKIVKAFAVLEVSKLKPPCSELKLAFAPAKSILSSPLVPVSRVSLKTSPAPVTFTSNGVEGLVVPIPTLPSAVTRICSNIPEAAPAVPSEVVQKDK